MKDKDEKRGRTDLRVPEMIDYIRICKRYDKVGVLEFKGAYNEEQMGRLVAEIEAEYSLEKMIFISFSFENLLVLRKLRPDTHVQYLVGAFETEEKFDECVATLCEHKMGIDIWSRALTEERVKKLLDNGIERGGIVGGQLGSSREHTANGWIEPLEERQEIQSHAVTCICPRFI